MSHHSAPSHALPCGLRVTGYLIQQQYLPSLISVSWTLYLHRFTFPHRAETV